MDRDDRVSPRTATIVTLGMALFSWVGLLGLVRLTLVVF